MLPINAALSPQDLSRYQKKFLAILHHPMLRLIIDLLYFGVVVPIKLNPVAGLDNAAPSDLSDSPMALKTWYDED